MSLYAALRPIFFRLSAESAHHAGIRAGQIGQKLGPLTRGLFRPALSEAERAILRTRVLGLDFECPIGIAAGLDKNAELIPLWSQIGGGFCEVGSVSAQPSGGNPKPRAFRLPQDGALVNRMGLNNHGAERIARRLSELRRPEGFPVGINIAKTHDPKILGQAGIDDFVESARHMIPHADFVVVNVSCPNTAEGKTFEDPEALAPLLRAVAAERDRQASLPGRSSVPLLVKLSPPGAVEFDGGPVDELVDLSLECGASGFVATNTASDRSGLQSPPDRLSAIGKGGLSGRPLRARATALVRHLRRKLDGSAPIIGVGGIDSVEAAYERVVSGADLVEVYTGLVYEGPGLVGKVAKGLAREAQREGFDHIADAVGSRA